MEPRSRPHRPTKEEIAQAEGRTVPDLLAHGLDFLFCGINPGLYSGATGHHFARPGNRFWPTLHAAGFTDRLLAPHEEHLLLEYGCGITNLVERATARADVLSRDELVAGAKDVVEKVRAYHPRCLAVLGVTAYRAAFEHPGATVGLQETSIGETAVWVLPNPSGLNAHYKPADLARVFATLRTAFRQ